MFRPLPLFIGLRYTRAKRRNHFISFISATSMLGIALGIIALIVVLSVMNGFRTEIQARILGMTSHATLSDPAGIPDWRDLLTEVRRQPGVVGAAPYVEIESMLMQGSRTSGALLRGILPEEEGAVSEVGSKMIAGSLDALKPGEYGIVLGRELAAVLGAGMGDKVTVVTPELSATPVGVMPRLKAFTVVGLFEVGMSDYDRGAGFIHMADGARLLRLGDAAGGVRLKLDDMWRAPLVAREIEANLDQPYRVTDWTQLHRNFFAALATEKRMMTVILFLIVAVAAFNIVSALVMVVTDKRADIAVLRTLGASPGQVMATFMVQGTAIGAFGTLLGVVGGVLLGINVETIVGAIEQAFNVHFLDPDLYYISALPSDVRAPDVLSIGLGAFVMSVLATLYPSWRASRTDPAEALRYE